MVDYTKLSGLLDQAYNIQTPQQGAIGGAAQAIAPMMGYQSTPVSLGQVLAAAGGGAVQGRQQALQNRIGLADVQQKMEQARLAQEMAVAEQGALNQYAQQLGLPPGTPREVITEQLKLQQSMGKYGPAKKVRDPNSATGYSWVETNQQGQQRIVGEAAAPTSGMTVNMGDQGQKLSPGAGKRIEANWKTIDDAARTIDKATYMSDLAAQTPTGPAAEWRLWGSKWANAMGFDVDMDEVSSLEQFRAKQMDFVMDRIAGTKGAISEKEMNAFQEAGPNIANSPLGNQIIAKVMAEQARRDQELAILENELLNQGYTRTGAFREVEKRRQEFRNTPVLTDEELAAIRGGGEATGLRGSVGSIGGPQLDDEVSGALSRWSD